MQSFAANERWNLLLLEEGEYYFRDHASYYWKDGRRWVASLWLLLWPWAVSVAAQALRRLWAAGHAAALGARCALPSCRVAGQLKVCSLSLYFVPRDIQEPIFRVPYKSTTALEE